MGLGQRYNQNQVHYLWARVSYADTADIGVHMGHLPANAVIVGGTLSIQEQFSGEVQIVAVTGYEDDAVSLLGWTLTGAETQGTVSAGSVLGAMATTEDIAIYALAAPNSETAGEAVMCLSYIVLQ